MFFFKVIATKIRVKFVINALKLTPTNRDSGSYAKFRDQ